MKPATAIIADDERLLREQLRRRLAEAWPELEIVGEAKNGVEAVSLVEALAPDFAFLDIRMPEKSGLEAAREIAGRSHVVFVTAYDAHAVEAFEHGALDYVLKPADPERLAVTVGRLRRRLAERSTADLEAALDRLESLTGRNDRRRPATSTAFLQWVQAGLGPQLKLLPVAEVVFFQAQDKYTAVATAGDLVLVRKPIREFVEALDPTLFWQIHRGTVVAVREIAAVIREDERMTVSLRSRGEKLEVSRSFAGRFRQM